MKPFWNGKGMNDKAPIWILVIHTRHGYRVQETFYVDVSLPALWSLLKSYESYMIPIVV